jgi:hypothetical protein
MVNNRCIAVKYTLVWSAVVSCACSLLIWFSVAFQHVRAILSFNFRLAINWAPKKWRESYNDKEDLCCDRNFPPCLARRRGNVHRLSRPNLFSRAKHSTMPVSPHVPMKARPPAPLACSPAPTNKRVTLVCQLGTVFAYVLAKRLLCPALLLDCRPFPKLLECAVRVLVVPLWTSLFSVFVLCSLYTRLSKNEWSCKMEGLLHLYKGSGNILANHWWRFRIQCRNRSHEWLKKC